MNFWKETKLPSINFDNLFCEEEEKFDEKVKIEKIKMLMNYFERMTAEKGKFQISKFFFNFFFSYTFWNC